MSTRSHDDTADEDHRARDADADAEAELEPNPAAGAGTDPSSGPVRDRQKVAAADEDRNP
jgi:hypothetical protein